MNTATLGEACMLIDGRLVDSRSGRWFDNFNPFTEEALGVAADGETADVHIAIAAARRAFDDSDWAVNLPRRKECLRQLQSALESAREQIRRELVAEVGTPVSMTHGMQLDIPLAQTIPWFVDNVEAFEWERDLPHGMALGVPSWRRVYREPVGVVAAIAPWNFPFEVALSTVAQALITGNTVILKPAADTPWSATRLGRLVAEQTDIPPGVFQVVTTSRAEVSEHLIASDAVDLVSFTGPTSVGRRIAELCGAKMGRALLELSGKSANIVLDDSDFSSAIPRAAQSICAHAGQGCSMLSRLLVPWSRYDEAVELAAKALREVVYGDPADPATMQGPQINAAQRDRVLGYIRSGLAEGARLVCGGGVPDHPPTGYFVEPTLFADVESTMTIAQDEIFGPVLVVMGFNDDDDAVHIANETIFGLNLGVTSADPTRAMSVAKRVRSGTAAINGAAWYGPDAPFGGFKASGSGRKNGWEGFMHYTEARTIAGPIDEIDVL
jgi:aldehyde dehydrogenase (NAD+)